MIVAKVDVWTAKRKAKILQSLGKYIENRFESLSYNQGDS